MTDRVDAARRHQAAYDVLPPDADDDLYALADRIADAVEAAIRAESEATVDRDALYRRIHALPGLVHYGKGEQCFPITDAVLAALAATPEAEDERQKRAALTETDRWMAVRNEARREAER